MNESQKNHLKFILEESGYLIKAKYLKGVKEYNSNLSEDYTADQLLDEAINEAVDQIVYLLTLREKLNASSDNARAS